MARGRILLEKALLRHPARSPAESSTLVLAQINEGQVSLWFRRQGWLQRQDFLLRRNAPWLSTLHDARQVLASPQFDQATLGELLGAQTSQSTSIHVPSPSQHFVRQIFITGMFV